MSSLNLDPDFNTTGLPIFEAADGVCFSFPWEPLVAVSSFFQDLQSLPVPAGGSQGHSDSELVIPLPAATSQALKVAFHAINSVATGEPLGMTPPTDPQVLIDLITLVDAYDLDPVAVLKPISSCANILEDAGRRFALAALRQDEDEMESCSQHLLKTPEKQMSEWLNAILSAKAPAAHYRLSQLYKQREDKIHAFRSEATCVARHSYYGFQKWCRYLPCTEYQTFSHLSFFALALQKIDELEVVIRQRYGEGAYGVIAGHLSSVSCSTCHMRLSIILRKGVDRFHSTGALKTLPWV